MILSFLQRREKLCRFCNKGGNLVSFYLCSSVCNVIKGARNQAKYKSLLFLSIFFTVVTLANFACRHHFFFPPLYSLRPPGSTPLPPSMVLHFSPSPNSRLPSFLSPPVTSLSSLSFPTHLLPASSFLLHSLTSPPSFPSIPLLFPLPSPLSHFTSFLPLLPTTSPPFSLSTSHLLPSFLSPLSPHLPPSPYSYISFFLPLPSLISSSFLSFPTHLLSPFLPPSLPAAVKAQLIIRQLMGLKILFASYLFFSSLAPGKRIDSS